MAESAAFLVVDKLVSFLLEEVKLQVKLFCGVRKEVEYIRAELERMTAFLRVADSMEDSDDEIKVWVRQVRDVAHHTEDVLDVFMLRLMPCHHHQRSRYLVFLGKTSGCLKNIKVRYQIGGEIHSIKSRVKDIAEGHQRYRLKYNLLLEDGSSSSTTTTHVVNKNKLYDSRGDARLVKEAELVGFDKRKQDLIGLLVDQTGDSGAFKVVSVVGMGGLGKTTLVKKVSDDAALKKHFESHAWLTVSESPKMEELLKDMIQQLYREINQPVPQELERTDVIRLKEAINEFLLQRSYLVVLDDIWKIDAWEAVKYAFPDNNSKSRIVLTTRSEDIASTASTETGGFVYSLKPLSLEDAWTLFCRKAFPGKSSCPRHLEDISRKILKRCAGLPLAIVAIGGVLATKNQSRIDEWHMLHRSLEANNKLQNMKNILCLSYNDLPWYLKICFLYLSIFPEDHEIECMRLIRLWTAEGFVQVSEDGLTIEEVAEGYVIELLNRSLLQVTEKTVDGRAKTCHIHDLLREIISIPKSREQNVVTIASEQNTRSLGKVRRLSIHNETFGIVQQSVQLSHLRSLFMFGVSDPLSKSSMPILFSGNCRLLKVLELRNASLETVPEEVFKLFCLRYLSLRGTNVKMLPNSIGNLVDLETLDLKETCVTKLPVEIQKLQRLRHLLVYTYTTFVGFNRPFHSTHGFEVSKVIGDLSSLQKLCYVDASRGDGGSAIASELGKLTQLRRLGIVKLRREDGMSLCSSIEKLSNLRSLSVSSTEEDEILDVQSLPSNSLPQFLRTLELQGCLEKLPLWILSLDNLVRLVLKWSKLRDDPLQSLQDLPNLMEINLDHAYHGEELCFKAGGFPMLKILRLIRLKGLRWVKMEEGAMPHLEELTIADCQLVKERPSGIEHLTKLQKLDLVEMPTELLMKLDKSRGGADYWKVAHIPYVRIFVTLDGVLRMFKI